MKKTNILIGVLTVVVGLCGYLLDLTYKGLHDDIQDLRKTMTPRSEVLLEIETMKKGDTALESELAELRLRIATVEQELIAKKTKP